MATPRVFVSSTCYDLKYIRQNLKYFIRSIGYECILSEDGDVFYDPDIHTHDACLSEIPSCQIFVLIIGGRFGGKYKKDDKSITNKEYEEAVRQNIPVFTLIDSNVLNNHLLYQQNQNNVTITYPSVDDTKIFDFINQVRKCNCNNAYFPFSNYHDIEVYLKKQLSGMMHRFLTNFIETRTVASLFEEIHAATEKIEYYTKQVALNMSDNHTVTMIKIYDEMTNRDIIDSFRTWNIKLTPYLIVKHKSIDEVCNGQIDFPTNLVSIRSMLGGGPPYVCSREQYEDMKRKYKSLRNYILKLLEETNCTEEQFLQYEGRI